MLFVLLSNFSSILLERSILRSETRPKNASVGMVSMAFFDKFRVINCNNPSKALLLLNERGINEYEWYFIKMGRDTEKIEFCCYKTRFIFYLILFI